MEAVGLLMEMNNIRVVRRLKIFCRTLGGAQATKANLLSWSHDESLTVTKICFSELPPGPWVIGPKSGGVKAVWPVSSARLLSHAPRSMYHAFLKWNHSHSYPYGPVMRSSRGLNDTTLVWMGYFLL